MAIRDDIMEFYTSGKEIGRLEKGIGPLELARTRELLKRYLPPAPAMVRDIGCGPGAYSLWLAERGYRMHLVDPVPLHIKHALRAAQEASLAFESTHIGDARAVDLPDGGADAVILHGPLYHLTERKERLNAITEAKRLLRPGGHLLAFAVTRHASTLVGLCRGWVFDAAYRSMIDEELTSGYHRPPANWKVMTTAFFHLPDELAAELEEAGLEYRETVGIEGSAWMAPNFEEHWKETDRRETLLSLARTMEKEPVLSPHILGVAYKRADLT